MAPGSRRRLIERGADREAEFGSLRQLRCTFAPGDEVAFRNRCLDLRGLGASSGGSRMSRFKPLSAELGCRARAILEPDDMNAMVSPGQRKEAGARFLGSWG